jgi:hypothetical protein
MLATAYENMKSTFYVLILSLLLASPAMGQQKKKPRPAKPRPAPAKQQAPKPVGIIGSTVLIVTRNQDRIAGELLDLSPYSVKIKSDSLESTLALDTVDSIVFGSGPVPHQNSEPAPQQTPSADFAKDAEAVINAFVSFESDLKSPMDYTEYGRRASDLRRLAERFLVRNCSSDKPGETRVVSLLWSAITDYGWARNIWTLKFGRSSDGTASEGESPTLADALASYPDIKTQAANGDKYVVEKVITGLWKKAEEKIDRARAALGH